MSDIDIDIDIDALRPWVGRRETRTDLITAAPLAALAATLDRDDLATGVPPLYHRLYFLPVALMAQLGSDGHPARGGFLPPVPLPRRMWAASRLVFHGSLRVGDNVTRSSEITDVQLKEGKSGALVFVSLRHAVMSTSGVAAITEERDIVYRDHPRPGAPEAPAKRHPPLQARGRWTEVGTPAGPIPAVKPPATTDSFAYRMGDVPALGQHTEAILREFGCSAGEVEAMRAAGVV